MKIYMKRIAALLAAAVLVPFTLCMSAGAGKLSGEMQPMETDDEYELPEIPDEGLMSSTETTTTSYTAPFTETTTTSYTAPFTVHICQHRACNNGNQCTGISAHQ